MLRNRSTSHSHNGLQ